MSPAEKWGIRDWLRAQRPKVRIKRSPAQCERIRRAAVLREHLKRVAKRASA